MKERIRQFLDKITLYNQVVDEYKRAVDAAPDHAMAYVKWGIDLAQDNKLEESLEKFQQATVISPSRFEPYVNWGVALARLNRLDEAIDKFKTAVEKNSKAVNPRILWGAALMEKGQIAEARAQYEQAIALAPENPEVYLSWGTALARAGAYQEAIKNIKQSLTIQGYQPLLYFFWGLILAEMEDYESAIEKFQICLRFLPKHAEAFYFWSISLNRLGRYEEALQRSKKALSLKLEKPEVYLNQGDILANLNRLDVAIANYRHALLLEPNLAEAYFSWGIASCKLGEFEEGYSHFAKALELEPDFKGVQRQWGHYLLSENRYEEALPHLRKAITEEPKQLEARMNLALALIKTEQQAEAVEILFEVEQEHQWNPQVQYLLGTHFMGAGNWQKAKEYLEKTLEEKPDFTDAAINLALVFCEMDQSMEAVRRMRPLIRREPDSARVNFYYGVVLFRHGDYKDALVKYNKALSIQPDYLEAKLGQGEALLKLDQLAEAEQALKTVLEQKPDSLPALSLMALCQLQQAEALLEEEADFKLQKQAFLAASNSYEHLLKLDAKHWRARADLAYIQGRLNSLEAMNSAFEAWISESSGEQKATALYFWGKALHKLGQTEAGQEKIAQAQQEKPDIALDM